MRIARLLVAHRPETILQADRILELTPKGLREVKHADLRTYQTDANWSARRIAV
jgi:ABC-type multidrug transport system fused ATPase/permease subunit